MPVLMTCPSCDSKLKVPDQMASSGKLLKCPKCAEKIPLGETQRKAATSRAGVPARKDTMPAPPPPPRGKSANRPKEADVPGDTMLGQTSWMLRFKERFLLTNWYDKRYEIFQPGTQDMVGVMEENPALWVRLLRGLGRLWSYLPNKYEVRDADGKPILFTVRYDGFSFRKRVEVIDADGQLIAAFVLKLFTLVTNFTVYGADNEQIGEFRFQMADLRNGKAPRVSLLLDGVEQGSVTGEEEQAMTRQFQEGKKLAVKVKFMPQKAGLYIVVSPASAGDPRVKIQLLAGALVLKLFGFDKMFLST
jgi:hypothetical protein